MDLLKNIGFWLKVNHIQRIRQYGLISHIKYVFNWNISKISINLQRDLTTLPKLTHPKKYSLAEMDISNPFEVERWCKIIKTSYKDSKVDADSFYRHLKMHPFLTNIKVFFIKKNASYVGTVSVGLYKKDVTVFGGARMAILPSDQGYLGYYLINYMNHYYKKLGIKKCESLIGLRRKSSLMIHFRHGFEPIFDRNKIMVDNQKRMWPARMIARKRVMKLYNHVKRKNT